MNFAGKIFDVSSFEELLKLAPELEKHTFENKLVLIRGLAPLSKEKYLAFAKLVAPRENPFVKWDFGEVMELIEKVDPENYLFSNEPVPFHWDGAFHVVPSILLFNCIESASAGGRTLFSDTEKMIAALGKKEQRALESMVFSYKTEKRAHYGGEVRQRVLSQHPVTGKPVLLFGEKVTTKRNPVERVLTDETNEKKSLAEKLDALLYEKDICYAHEWKNGDILLADNHALLHGRQAFASRWPRHIRRIQLRVP